MLTESVLALDKAVDTMPNLISRNRGAAGHHLLKQNLLRREAWLSQMAPAVNYDGISVTTQHVDKMTAVPALPCSKKNGSMNSSWSSIDLPKEQWREQ